MYDIKENFCLSAVTMRCTSFFFFQAEDGIRDLTVTGVQTCALPIWVRMEDRELVAVVLEEPDFGLDLEPEAVRRGLGVPTGLVTDGMAVPQEDEADRKSVV